MNLFPWLLARLSENSTWRGLVLVATAAGLKLAPELWDSIISVGLAVVGLINIVRKGPNATTTTTTSSVTRSPVP
jgi:hypothetical protein